MVCAVLILHARYPRLCLVFTGDSAVVADPAWASDRVAARVGGTVADPGCPSGRAVAGTFDSTRLGPYCVASSSETAPSEVRRGMMCAPPRSLGLKPNVRSPAVIGPEAHLIEVNFINPPSTGRQPR